MSIRPNKLNAAPMGRFFHVSQNRKQLQLPRTKGRATGKVHAIREKAKELTNVIDELVQTAGRSR